MRFSTQVKSVSYLKTNAAEVLKEIADSRQPLIITQHGEASAVLLDVKAYEQMQETLAMLKLLVLGQRQEASGNFRRIEEVVDRIRPTFRAD